jgi:hypothetical protein
MMMFIEMHIRLANQINWSELVAMHSWRWRWRGGMHANDAEMQCLLGSEASLRVAIQSTLETEFLGRRTSAVQLMAVAAVGRRPCRAPP